MATFTLLQASEEMPNKLYQDIHSGKEKRVRLIKADTWEEQQKFIADADYVILACGYHTAKIPIKTSEGKEIKLDVKISGTQ